MLSSSSGAPGNARIRRVHGLQVPLQPLQVLGWLWLAVASSTAFLVLVPALRIIWVRAIAAGFLASLLILHVVAHLAATLLDPAEAAVRSLPRRPLPDLDRAKHAHAIEAGRCHLCCVSTSGPKTKHCSLCNKCVARFDHHCKWLNQCVGARNYLAFLMCVCTALAAALTVAVLAVAELVFYYVQPQWLILWDSSSNLPTNLETEAVSTTTQPPSAALVSGDVAFLIVVGVLAVLAAITAGLLLHLCFFHVYISFLGLTTYEYIRTQRQSQTTLPTTATPTIGVDTLTPGSENGVDITTGTSERRPGSLRCGTGGRVAVYACAVLENRTQEICNGCPTSQNNTEPPSTASMYTLSSEEDTRGTSPQRRRPQRKWNCCISVPDSPEEPDATGGASVHKTKCILSLCKYKSRSKTAVPGNETLSLPAASSTETISQGTTRGPRIRVLFRVFGHWTHGRRHRHQHTSQPVRNNQVVPLASEDSTSTDGVQLVRPCSANLTAPPSPQRSFSSPQETTIPRRALRLPALPPPTRRRLSTVPGGEQVLVDALSLIPLPPPPPPRPVHRQLAHYHRRRRSVVHHRPKTPTLSPIRESGLSNPASPSKQNECVSVAANSHLRLL